MQQDTRPITTVTLASETTQTVSLGIYDVSYAHPQFTHATTPKVANITMQTFSHAQADGSHEYFCTITHTASLRPVTVVIYEISP